MLLPHVFESVVFDEDVVEKKLINKLDLDAIAPKRKGTKSFIGLLSFSRILDLDIFHRRNQIALPFTRPKCVLVSQRDHNMLHAPPRFMKTSHASSHAAWVSSAPFSSPKANCAASLSFNTKCMTCLYVSLNKYVTGDGLSSVSTSTRPAVSRMRLIVSRLLYRWQTIRSGRWPSARHSTLC